MRKAVKMAADKYEEEGVGDCSSNHLLNVRKSAKELMRVALQSKENASILEDVHPVSKDIHTLIKEKECLLKEKRSYEVELELRRKLLEETLSDTTVSVEDLQERVDGLEVEVASVRARYSQDKQLLQRLQSSDVLTEHVFQRPHPTIEEKALREVLMKHTELSVEVVRVCREVGEEEREVTKIRREREDHMEHCQTLVTQIEELKRAKVSDVSTTEETASLMAKLQVKIAECKLLRGCLQGLIVSSGMNWSENQQLRDLTISLGHTFPWEHNQ